MTQMEGGVITDSFVVINWVINELINQSRWCFITSLMWKRCTLKIKCSTKEGNEKTQTHRPPPPSERPWTHHGHTHLYSHVSFILLTSWTSCKRSHLKFPAEKNSHIYLLIQKSDFMFSVVLMCPAHFITEILCVCVCDIKPKLTINVLLTVVNKDHLKARGRY